MIALEPAGLEVLAILAMAAMTFLVRAAGFWMMGHVPPSARTRRMLEALPGSIVSATVLPIVAKSGTVAVLAVAAAVAIMIMLRNALLAIAVGAAAAALARNAGF